MRIWLVCRDGRPRAVFSTAAGAADFVADHGGEIRCDVQYFLLDACSRARRFFLPAPTAETPALATSAAQGSPGIPGEERRHETR